MFKVYTLMMIHIYCKMISILRLVKTSIPLHNYQFCVCSDYI